MIGDIIGKPGREAVETALPSLREERGIDFVTANGENVAGGMGLTGSTAEALLAAGVERFLRVTAPVVLDHEEHAAIAVPPGTYRVVIQREYVAPETTARPWDVAPTSLQLALARGHRWLAMLESGEAKSLKEIATREGIDNSYVSRMVNLTTLAPDIVAAILDDALPNHITLFDLAVDPPALWDEQRARVGL